MMGALRSMATDVLEAHANLHPLDLRIQNICHQAAIRLASHPTLTPSPRSYVERRNDTSKDTNHPCTHACLLRLTRVEISIDLKD